MIYFICFTRQLRHSIVEVDEQSRWNKLKALTKYKGPNDWWDALFLNPFFLNFDQLPAAKKETKMVYPIKHLAFLLQSQKSVNFWGQISKDLSPTSYTMICAIYHKYHDSLDIEELHSKSFCFVKKSRKHVLGT